VALETEDGTMETEKIEKILYSVIRKVLPRAENIYHQTRFREDLGADSMDMTSLIMEIEDEFHTRIDDAMAQSVVTIQDAIRMIDKTLRTDAMLSNVMKQQVQFGTLPS
jgi:acyl carrier protein